MRNFKNGKIAAFLAILVLSPTVPMGCCVRQGKTVLKREYTEADMIRKFREQINRGNLENIDLIYRIAGGMPAEGRIEHEVRIVGRSGSVTVRNRSGDGSAEEASGDIETAEFQTLLRSIDQNMDSLIPRSEAQFLPDSVVGSISIEIEGEKETYYFLVEEEPHGVQSESFAAQQPVEETMNEFSQLSQKILERN